MPLLTLRGYAASRKARGLSGGSPAAVAKAINAGRITRQGDGRIDSQVADVQWMKNTEPRAQSERPSQCVRVRADQPGGEVAEGAGLSSAPGAPGGGDPAAHDVFLRARAAKETFAAKKAQLEYEQLVKGGGESADASPSPSVTPLTSARVEVTRESAAIKTIQRRKLEGALLEVEEVDQTWAEVLQVLKDRLRLIADNIAPVLATCGTEAECRSVVMREVDDALTAVSQGIAALVTT
jgi:hypothetical protein